MCSVVVCRLCGEGEGEWGRDFFDALEFLSTAFCRVAPIAVTALSHQHVSRDETSPIMPNSCQLRECLGQNSFSRICPRDSSRLCIESEAFRGSLIIATVLMCRDLAVLCGCEGEHAEM